MFQQGEQCLGSLCAKVPAQPHTGGDTRQGPLEKCLLSITKKDEKSTYSPRNTSISSKSAFSTHPVRKFLASSDHCACAKSLCRHPKLLLQARRLQYFSPPCSASLQSIWEMPFPSCIHFIPVPTPSVSPRLELQGKVKASKLKSSITMFLAPRLPLPPPLQLLAVTPPSALGYSLTKCNFSSVQAHLAGLGLTRDLLHLKPKPNKNKQNPTNQQ